MFCTDLQQEGAALHCMLPSCANAILQCNAIAMHACTHRWQPLHKHTKGDEEKKTRSLVKIVAQQDKIESILAPPPIFSSLQKKKKTLAIWLFALSLHKRHLILWGVFYFTWSQAWAFFLSLSLSHSLFLSSLWKMCRESSSSFQYPRTMDFLAGENHMKLWQPIYLRIFVKWDSDTHIQSR